MTLNEAMSIPWKGRRDPAPGATVRVILSNNICVNDTRDAATASRQFDHVNDILKANEGRVVDLVWVNILDAETNPFGNIGHYEILIEELPE